MASFICKSCALKSGCDDSEMEGNVEGCGDYKVQDKIYFIFTENTAEEEVNDLLDIFIADGGCIESFGTPEDPDTVKDELTLRGFEVRDIKGKDFYVVTKGHASKEELVAALKAVLEYTDSEIEKLNLG